MRTLVLVFCLLAVAFGADQQIQQACRSCTTNTCNAPWPTLSGTCVNGEWVYTGPITLVGSVTIHCPVRVNGVLNINAGTTFEVQDCGKLAVDTLNAPSGFSVDLDLGGNAPAIGSSKSFLSFTNATGYISGLNVNNIGNGPAFAMFGSLANNQASILFLAPGSADPGQNQINTATPPPPADPNFAPNGDRIRQCPKYNCTNPSICNDPTGGGGATCDPSTGEWVISSDISISTANLSCPLRIAGSFRVTSSLNIFGCARIHVTGIAVLSGTDETSLVSVNLDLNAYGKANPGDQFAWLTADGGIIGGLSGVNFQNIWDPQNQVNVVNQACGNSYSVIFYPINGVSPGWTCASTAGSNAVADVDAATAIAENHANNGDFAVADELLVDDFAIHGDVDLALDTLEASLAVAANQDANLAVTADHDANLAVAADQDANLAVAADQDANLAVAADPAFTEDLNANAVAGDFAFADPHAGDYNVMDAAVDAGNTAASNSNAVSIPSYAIALLVLGILLVLGLIIIQVQLVLLRRARANNYVQKA